MHNNKRDRDLRDVKYSLVIYCTRIIAEEVHRIKLFLTSDSMKRCLELNVLLPVHLA
jgi:hypothetical protein